MKSVCRIATIHFSPSKGRPLARCSEDRGAGAGGVGLCLIVQVRVRLRGGSCSTSVNGSVRCPEASGQSVH
jgi:hypothetical protein